MKPGSHSFLVEPMLVDKRELLEEQRKILCLLAVNTWILTPLEMDVLMNYLEAWGRYKQAERTGVA